MKYLAREISKLIMFAITWGIPVVLSKVNQNNYYLFFFILSSLVTIGLFSHYEDIESMDHKNNNHE